MRIKSALILLFALALAGGGAVSAAPPAPPASLSISVSPALLELSVKPGATLEQEVTVTNGGDQAFDATIAVAPMPGGIASDSAVNWLKIEPTALHLDPNQKGTVKVSVTVPTGLRSGGYYAQVTATTGATKAAGTAAGISGQLGVPFLFTVQGEGAIVQQASIERFAPMLESDGRLSFRMLVKNGGNVHVITQGKVEIADANGKHYASLDFPPSGRILPATERILQTQGSIPVQSGATYKAATSMTYGDKKAPLTADATFKVAPPSVSVGDMTVCENLDKGPTLSASLKDDGDLALEPTIQLGVRTASGTDLGEAALPGPTLLWPHESAAVKVDFPQRLDSGQYVFVVTTQFAPGKPVTKEFPFQIGGTGANVAPLCATQGTPAA